MITDKYLKELPENVQSIYITINHPNGKMDVEYYPIYDKAYRRRWSPQKFFIKGGSFNNKEMADLINTHYKDRIVGFGYYLNGNKYMANDKLHGRKTTPKKSSISFLENSVKQMF